MALQLRNTFGFPKIFILKILNDIYKHKEKATAHLKRLEEVLGKSYRYTVDFECHHRNLRPSIFKNKMAELILDHYLGALIDNILQFLKANPNKRQTFLIKSHKYEIEFSSMHVTAARPMEVRFRDGAICIYTQTEEFGMLPEKTGENISRLFQ